MCLAGSDLRLCCTDAGVLTPLYCCWAVAYKNAYTAAEAYLLTAVIYGSCCNSTLTNCLG